MNVLEKAIIIITIIYNKSGMKAARPATGSPAPPARRCNVIK